MKLGCLHDGTLGMWFIMGNKRTPASPGDEKFRAASQRPRLFDIPRWEQTSSET
jgi:hypothetical protein